MSILRNYWYVAAMPEEISFGKTMARMICNEAIVFFRGEDGTVVALEDRCCHRHYPLSPGEVEGNAIRCGYHGFLFNAEGKCIEIPGQASIPRSAYVKRYPVVERHRWVWVWIGDEELANVDNIPDYHWFDDVNWRGKSSYFHVKSNYRLIVENLLDLSHLSFVHKSTIGNRAVADSAKVTFDRNDYEVRVNRWMRSVPPPPSYARANKVASDLIDRWQIIHFMPPAFCRLYVGAMTPGMSQEEALAADKMEWLNLNAMTPETEDTTHYFWGQVHNHDLDKPEVTEMIFNEVLTAFLQDKEIFELQAQNLARGVDRPEVNTLADAGSLHAARIINRLFSEQEAGVGKSITPELLQFGPHW